jgi:hypothetical protein
LNRLDFGQLTELCWIAGQGTHGVATIEEGPGHVPADESSGSRDKSGLHRKAGFSLRGALAPLS